MAKCYEGTEFTVEQIRIEADSAWKNLKAGWRFKKSPSGLISFIFLEQESSKKLNRRTLFTMRLSLWHDGNI